MIKKPLLVVLLFLSSFAYSQIPTLAGFAIIDSLVSAKHPKCLSPGWVTGLPDDSIWVHFITSSPNDSMVGTFSSLSADRTGYDLMLETGFNTCNYNVKLRLKNGQYSAVHHVAEIDWKKAGTLNWTWLDYGGCNTASGVYPHYVLPLDFDGDFGLTATDSVAGIKINFLASNGDPDLGGAYIIDPCPVINLGNDTTLCKGQSLKLVATVAGGTYLWQDLTTDSILKVTLPGTYWVTVSVFGCSVSDTIHIYNSLDSVPAFTLGPDTTLCKGDSIILDPSVTNVSFLWSDLSSVSIFTVTAKGKYWLTISSGTCKATDTVKIFYSTLQANLGNDTSLCTGDVLQLFAHAPNAAITWQNNSTDSVFTVTQAGTFILELRENNCIERDSILIDYKPGPEIELGPDLDLCLNTKVLLNATFPGASYLWKDGSTHPVFAAKASGKYWVQLTLNSCTFSDSIQVNFSRCKAVLEMPNVFTPGNDSLNEIFSPMEYEGIEKAMMVIFNRWGQEIFKTYDLQAGWNGNDFAAGTYYWIVNYTNVNSEDVSLNGTVTLIK